MTTVFLIVVLFIHGEPAVGYKDFANFDDCNVAKHKLYEVLTQREIKPLYLECRTEASGKTKINGSNQFGDPSVVGADLRAYGLGE